MKLWKWILGGPSAFNLTYRIKKPKRGRPPRTPLENLERRVDKLTRSLRREGKTDAVKAQAKALVGECLSEIDKRLEDLERTALQYDKAKAPQVHPNTMGMMPGGRVQAEKPKEPGDGK